MALAVSLMAGCREASPPPVVVPDVVADSARAATEVRALEVRADIAEPTGPFALVEGAGREDGPIAYELIEPSNATPRTPIVVALHGMGDTPAGFARLMRSIGVRARYVVARGVLAWPEAGGFEWYDNDAGDAAVQIRARVHDLVTLADQLATRFPEAGKPVLIGFSQGAAVVLQAAFDAPDRWRAVVGLSGFLASASDPQTPTTDYPILVASGTEDDRVAPKLSWFAAGWLEKVGHKDVRKLAFEGGHAVPHEVVDKVRALLAEVFAPAS